MWRESSLDAAVAGERNQAKAGRERDALAAILQPSPVYMVYPSSANDPESLEFGLRGLREIVDSEVD